jgi:hypothetical protein
MALTEQKKKKKKKKKKKNSGTKSIGCTVSRHNGVA